MAQLHKQKAFENRRFAGKQEVSVTVGTSRRTYKHDGRSGDIDLMCGRSNFKLAYAGYEIRAPFVAYGVEAGLRYSDPAAIQERLKAIVANFRGILPQFSEREPVLFNRMEEGGRTAA